MQSSSGAHFIALDHIRALAAFMVFAWHFNHAENGYPVPFDYTPALFPFSLLDEGHTGVALFMALSGYLFAKLLDGRSIDYRIFVWNRALRLLPLLVVMILIIALQKLVNGESLSAYAYLIVQGALFPSLPYGGWSITVEFHYYLTLPLFFWLLRKSKSLPLVIIVAAIVLRLFLHHQKGEIQYLSYFTLIGRIDQFALGMLLFQFRAYLTRRHVMTIAIIVVFMMGYWYFDLQGGFYKNPSYPSPSRLWIFLPTIEGIVYAAGIAWYDTSFSPSTTGISRFIGRIGEFSYSIYLLHFFIVFHAAKFVNERIMDISNFYLACFWSLAFFVLMMIPASISFRFIEAPFLKLRRCYFIVPDYGQEVLAQVPAKGDPELER